MMPYPMTALLRVLPIVKTRIREMHAEDMASRMVRGKGYCDKIECNECVFDIPCSSLCINHQLVPDPRLITPHDSAKSRLYILTLLKVQP